jgi:hypothetical protein
MAVAAAHGGAVHQPEAREEWEKGARAVWTEFAGAVGGMERIEEAAAAGLP